MKYLFIFSGSVLLISLGIYIGFNHKIQQEPTLSVVLVYQDATKPPENTVKPPVKQPIPQSKRIIPTTITTYPLKPITPVIAPPVSAKKNITVKKESATSSLQDKQQCKSILQFVSPVYYSSILNSYDGNYLKCVQEQMYSLKKMMQIGAFANADAMKKKLLELEQLGY